MGDNSITQDIVQLMEVADVRVYRGSGRAV